MLWEMRLRSRHWLMRRDWKQLAPDDAYLSCEYSSCLPGVEERANAAWQIMTFDVS
jgi:hypothetical protein